jgi:hypothetical protein
MGLRGFERSMIAPFLYKPDVHVVGRVFQHTLGQLVESDSDFPLADSMRLKPMNFRIAYRTIR